jgi:hypothetical protein
MSMSMKRPPHIAAHEDQLTATDLEITDSTVVEYFQQFDSDAERENAFKRLLKVGVMTMNLAETSQEEGFVERKFTEMQRDLQEEINRIEKEVNEKFGDDGDVPEIFETHLGEDGRLRQQIEDAFGEDGVSTERLDEELGENGERIQEALDPNREGTPTHSLKQSLQDQIDRLRDQLNEQKGAEEKEEELRGKTPLKGDDFEETVENILMDLVYGTSNELEYTGETVGEIGDRKVGDFVTILDQTGQRIVVEAKSDSGYAQPDIKEELADAVENRYADYGIIVFECESYIPNKVGTSTSSTASACRSHSAKPKMMMSNRAFSASGSIGLLRAPCKDMSTRERPSTLRWFKKAWVK